MELSMFDLSQNILVAIDGSAPSDKAAETAVRLAQSTSTAHFKSILFAVVVRPARDDPSLHDHYFGGSGKLADWEARQQRIFYVVDKAAAETGIQLRKAIVYGEVDEQLLQFAEAECCDLIVIGSATKGRLLRTLKGSVSARVAMKARCSVYIVR
jgi:nucleotide-binding universal stress UspA family protein